MGSTNIETGRQRIVIEALVPKVNSGRFPVKRVVGESVTVEADVFADGHDVVSARILYYSDSEPEELEEPMVPLINDRFQGKFTVTKLSRYYFTVEGWVDYFASWVLQMRKRLNAGQATQIDIEVGAKLILEAASRASEQDSKRLVAMADLLAKSDILKEPQSVGRFDKMARVISHLMARYPDRTSASRYDRWLEVSVDRPKARFSAWYELFPRSWSLDANRSGTFKDVIARLPYIADLGFDVLYFPPIHPIGVTFRKGKNNALKASPEDPGSPWGIGSVEGGHKAILSELGTLNDFRKLVKTARDQYGIEIALDIALQCSPDHPYVTEHPEWFRKRPDGTIQYAENPPKKYQDIYPFDFECEAWESLWEEVKSIFEFWMQQGVKIFRVDNPHTKPFIFWEWLISGLKRKNAEVIFLAEAFTRPRVMHRLAKLGFTQSYTYFTWRNNKWEIESYLSELTQAPSREFFRPNLWPNTPDILHEYLQTGGRPAFIIRLILAATAGANYGIYGPVYELCINKPREEGSEEYLNSEKYEIKHWNLDSAESIAPIIQRVNQIRRENPALQSDWSAGGGLMIHPVDNPLLLCYSKRTEDCSNVILVVLNLDATFTQSGWVDLPLDTFGIRYDKPYEVEDLLSGERYRWQGGHNYIELNPLKMPAHIFRISID